MSSDHDIVAYSRVIWVFALRLPNIHYSMLCYQLCIIILNIGNKPLSWIILQKFTVKFIFYAREISHFDLKIVSIYKDPFSLNFPNQPMLVNCMIIIRWDHFGRGAKREKKFARRTLHRKKSLSRASKKKKNSIREKGFRKKYDEAAGRSTRTTWSPSNNKCQVSET